jgi:hypothetical protein
MRLVLVLAAVVALGCSRAAASTHAHAEESFGFALVELFTSEGCSSCPPADDVLGDLAADASRTGRRIYPLSFHVDYWDALGWPDPYGSAAATRRQHGYARALGQQGVYTPEMIVNGRDAFVGSRRSQARRSIESALREREGPRIDIRTRNDDGRVSVDVTISDDPRGAVLQIALVQQAAESRVEAGENAGRTLRHVNVVRAFQTVQLNANRTGRAAFPALPQTPGGGSNAVAIVAFLQDPGTMIVRGAARAELAR